MKAMGWKGGRKGDDAYMYSTKGQETDDQFYIVIIENEGSGFFHYALGTVEEGDPHIGEENSLPSTEASVSEFMNAVREGFGLGESMLPASTFAGSSKYKLGEPGQWRNDGPSKNRPAQRGDLVGSTDESEGSPEGLPHLTKTMLTHIVQQVGKEGAHAIIKSLNWGDGASKELLHLIVNDLEDDIKANDFKQEDAAGVGIITKQNSTVDVNKGTPRKNLKAFKLV